MIIMAWGHLFFLHWVHFTGSSWTNHHSRHIAEMALWMWIFRVDFLHGLFPLRMLHLASEITLLKFKNQEQPKFCLPWRTFCKTVSVLNIIYVFRKFKSSPTYKELVENMMNSTKTASRYNFERRIEMTAFTASPRWREHLYLHAATQSPYEKIWCTKSD